MASLVFVIVTVVEVARTPATQKARLTITKSSRKRNEEVRNRSNRRLKKLWQIMN